MATTLSYGYKKPATGDLGDVWFPALEDNIDRLNGHSHDGTDSAKLQSTSTKASHSTVASGSFVDQGDGYWRATVSMPAGTDFDDYLIIVKDPSTQDQMYLKVEKLSDTQFYIYINIAQDVEVYFVS